MLCVYLIATYLFFILNFDIQFELQVYNITTGTSIFSYVIRIEIILTALLTFDCIFIL
jgi:hypothetical protein